MKKEILALFFVLFTVVLIQGCKKKSGFSAKATPTSVILTCTASTSTGVTGYNFYRAPDGVTFTDVAPNQAACGATDTAITPGATYTYYATALAPGVESSPSASSVVTIPGGTPPPPGCTGSNFFTTNPTITDAKDATPVSLGTILKANVATTVCGIRWYKSPGTTASTHSYAIYSSTKAVLASGTTSGETASGWQTQALATAINVAAGATIVPTIFGVDYPDDQKYFTVAKTDVTGTFTAPINAGVYVEGSSTIAFPSLVFNASNYYVDVTFSAGTPPPPVISVAIAPTSVSVVEGGTVTFTATVTNDSANAGVTWTNAPGGVYTAPGTAGTATVTATSVTDPTKSASATVTITAPPLVLTCTNNGCVATGGTSGQKVTMQLNPPSGPSGTVTLP